MSDEDIAKKMHISRSTLSDWKARYPDISDALKKGKEICDFDAEDALLDLFRGHYVEEEITDIQIDGEGDKAQKVTHTRKTKRWIPPNVTAIIFYLKARAGWRDNVPITSAELEDDGFIKALKEKIDNSDWGGDDED